MDIRVEVFQPRDIQSVIDIENASFSEDAYSKAELIALFNQAKDLFLLARSNTDVVGDIIGTVNANRGYVVSIAVAPNYRRAGIGEMLLQTLIWKLCQKKVTVVKLHVRTTNTQAIRLYLKLGFSLDKIVPNYYEDSAPAFQMKLHLKDCFDETAL